MGARPVFSRATIPARPSRVSDPKYSPTKKAKPFLIIQNLMAKCMMADAVLATCY
jgi:hypothetical protein